MLEVQKEEKTPVAEDQSRAGKARAFLHGLRIPMEATVCFGGAVVALTIAAASAFWGEEVAGMLILAGVLAAFGGGIIALENHDPPPGAPPKGEDWA